MNNYEINIDERMTKKKEKRSNLCKNFLTPISQVLLKKLIKKKRRREIHSYL